MRSWCNPSWCPPHPFPWAGVIAGVIRANGFHWSAGTTPGAHDPAVNGGEGVLLMESGAPLIGYAGPSFNLGVPQIFVYRIYNKVEENDCGVEEDRAVIEMAVMTSTTTELRWVSTPYGGQEDYVCSSAPWTGFHWCPKNKTTGGPLHNSRGRFRAIGHLSIGEMFQQHLGWMTWDGAIHHMEMHRVALDDIQVLDVVKGLRPIFANDTATWNKCPRCRKGQSDLDLNPATSCQSCEAGRYSNSTGQLGACNKSCPLGSMTIQQGATSASDCSQCEPGKYGAIRGRISVCLECDPGQFSANPGLTCTACAPGMFSRPGSTSCKRSGCMDPWASNYDPHAQIDEGGCAYICSNLRQLAGADTVPGRCFIYNLSSNGWQQFNFTGDAPILSAPSVSDVRFYSGEEREGLAPREGEHGSPMWFDEPHGHINFRSPPPGEHWIMQGRPMPGYTPDRPIYLRCSWRIAGTSTRPAGSRAAWTIRYVAVTAVPEPGMVPPPPPGDPVYCALTAYDYRGSVATTISGRTCQAWAAQAPHSHSTTHNNYPEFGLDGEHNYCRNPDGEATAWCYTMDPASRQELCDVGEPNSDDSCPPPRPPSVYVSDKDAIDLSRLDSCPYPRLNDDRPDLDHRGWAIRNLNYLGMKPGVAPNSYDDVTLSHAFVGDTCMRNGGLRFWETSSYSVNKVSYTTFGRILTGELPFRTMATEELFYYVEVTKIYVYEGEYSFWWVSSGTRLTYDHTTFTDNTMQEGTSFILVKDGSTVRCKMVTFTRNFCADGGAAMFVLPGSSLDVEHSIFVNNTAKSLAVLGDTLYLQAPQSARILNSTFEPYRGANTVYLAGQLGTCEQHPCQPGYACRYIKYSLSCVPCVFPTVSRDGLKCEPCEAGYGPNPELTGCLSCDAAKYSQFGVCNEVPAGYISTRDRNAILDLDECAFNNGGCDPLAAKIGSCSTDGVCTSSCVNQIEGYRCGSCPAGYVSRTRLVNTSAPSTRNIEGTECSLLATELLPDGHANVIPRYTLQMSSVSNSVIGGPNSQDGAAFTNALIADLAVSLGSRPSQIKITEIVSLARRRTQSNSPSASTGRQQDLENVPIMFKFEVRDRTSTVHDQIEMLREHVHDPLSSLISGALSNLTSLVNGGIVPGQQVAAPEFVCPEGRVPSPAGSCQPCPLGEYTADRRACLSCPAKQISSESGAGCQCSAGFYDSSIATFACITSTTSDVNVPNVNNQVPNEDTCVQCSALAPCVMSCENGLPVANPGFAVLQPTLVADGLNKPNAVIFFQCPDDTARSESDGTVCHGGNISEAWKCRAGHTGPLCRICSDGYTRSGANCNSCVDGNDEIVAWIVLLTIAVTAVACFVLYCIRSLRKSSLMDGEQKVLKALFLKHDRDGSEGIDKKELQMMCAKLGHKLTEHGLAEAMAEMDKDDDGEIDFEEFSRWWAANGGKALSRFRSSITTRDMLQACMLTVLPLVKIIVGFAQIVAQLETVLQITLPKGIATLINAFKPLVANIWQSFIPVGCIAALDFYQRWIFSCFVMPAVCSLVAFLWYAGRRCCRSKRLHTAKSEDDLIVQLRGNISLVVFLLYPNVCREVFSVFTCRRLSADVDLLLTDFTIDCSSSTHQSFKLIAGLMIGVWCVGIPLAASLVLLVKARRIQAADAAVVAALAQAWNIETSEAVDAVQSIELGREYGFLLDVFRPGYYAWEPLDMSRKFLLVGMVAVVGRGSAAQLTVAIVLAAGFSWLHIRSWPYKQTADNVLKMTTEVQIFCTVVVGLALKANSDGGNVGYDMFLITTFILNVLVTFVLASIHKIRNARLLLRDGEGGDRKAQLWRAYMLHKASLASATDKTLLQDYLELLRQQGVTTLIATIEGHNKAARKSDGRLDMVLPKESPESIGSNCDPFVWETAEQDQRLPFLLKQQQESNHDILKETIGKTPGNASDATKDPFAKFSGGFEGTFADTQTFFGGLVKLIGEPQRNVSEAVRAEHCDVIEGFGASREELVAGNYGVVFTPVREYNFVADPVFTEPMACGVDFESKRPAVAGGFRKPLDIAEISKPKVAVDRINKCFETMHELEATITESMYESLQMTTVELVAMRLYTGPCFILYNGVLRAMATCGVVKFGFPAHLIGSSVHGRFCTTLHCINSGVIKMARIQPKCSVYRGMNGMKLPKSFIQKDDFGVRGGVEYGFMSTTLDWKIAKKYSQGSASTPQLIFEMEMGMVNRGALLSWLSQYPDEAEILLPPLTGLEVSSYSEAEDQSLVYKMQLNINMQSMTIEQVLALRKKQCLEMAEVVQRDLATHGCNGDIPRRLKAIKDKQEAINAQQDVNVFNNNAHFVEITAAMLAQLPRLGDEVEVLHMQTHCEEATGQFSIEEQEPPVVTGLVSLDTGNPSLISGVLAARSDGVLVAYGEPAGPRLLFPPKAANNNSDARHVPVLCVEVLSPLTAIAIGLFDHSIAILALDCKKDREQQPLQAQQSLQAHAGAVTALAWNQESHWLASGSTAGEVIVWVLDGLQLCESGSQMPQSDRARSILTGHSDAVRSLVWLPHDVLASGSLDGTLRLWRLAKDPITGIVSGDLIQSIVQHSGPVTGLAISRDDAEDSASYILLVSVSTDRSMCVWNCTTYELVTEILCCHDLGICTVCALPHSQVATASADTTIRIWQLSGNNVEPRLTLRGHINAVHSLCYIKSKGWLASGGKDKTIRLWRAKATQVTIDDANSVAAKTLPWLRQEKLEKTRAGEDPHYNHSSENVGVCCVENDLSTERQFKMHEGSESEGPRRNTRTGTTPQRSAQRSQQTPPRKQRDPPPLPDKRVQVRGQKRVKSP